MIWSVANTDLIWTDLTGPSICQGKDMYFTKPRGLSLTSRSDATKCRGRARPHHLREHFVVRLAQSANLHTSNYPLTQQNAAPAPSPSARLAR